MTYIRSHWQGEQSLLWSFWINLVVLRLAILFFERFTHPPYLEFSTLAITLTIIYGVVLQGGVLVWQGVGLQKACDRHLAGLGSYVTVWAVQFGAVVSILVTLIYVLGAFQALFADPGALPVNRILKRPPLLGDVTLVLSDDGTRLHLNGDFKLGLTRQLATLLEENPGVTGIDLDSNGGRVTEGRGVARIIIDKGLDTYVFNVCKSACTTAFIAGRVRTLGGDGRLGFHGFNLEGAMKTPYVDIEAEQKIDMVFYRKQNIDARFLDKVFKTSPTDIWFPTSDELLAAGVVHKVVGQAP